MLFLHAEIRPCAKTNFGDAPVIPELRNAALVLDSVLRGPRRCRRFEYRDDRIPILRPCSRYGGPRGIARLRDAGRLSGCCRDLRAAGVVPALLRSRPESAQAKGAGDELPLHHAAAGKASVEVVQALLAAHPEAAKEKDEGGRLPLDCAAGNQASVEVREERLPTSFG